MSQDLTSEQIADAIREWVLCESPSDQPERIGAMADLVARRAQDLGLAAHRHAIGEGGALPMLHVTTRAPGDARRGILALGHIDTVHPVGTLARNPCRIEGDRLYGPGSYDMKAGIFLALTAMGAPRARSDLPIDLLLVPDEETGSHASRLHTERFARNAVQVLVAEPARADAGKCVTARKGTGMVRLKVHGRPAHAGVQHERGRSAIREMAHQVLALEAMTDYGRGITVSVGTIRGGTVSNTVPALCEVDVDFRVPDQAAADLMLAQLKALAPVTPDTRLEADIELNRPPMVRSEAVADLLGRAQACARQAGFDLHEAPMTGGGSDGNFTSAQGVPTLDGIGAEGDGAHTLHEFVVVSTLARRLAFWRGLLAELAAGH